MKRLNLLTITCLFALSGCGHIGRQQEEPALLIKDDIDSQQQLTLQLRHYLGQKKLALAKNTLTTSNVLLIRGLPIQSIQQQSTITGFDMRKPRRFTLIKQHNTCMLIDNDNKHPIILTKVKCKTH